MLLWPWLSVMKDFDSKKLIIKQVLTLNLITSEHKSGISQCQLTLSAKQAQRFHKITHEN